MTHPTIQSNYNYPTPPENYEVLFKYVYHSIPQKRKVSEKAVLTSRPDRFSDKIKKT